MTVTSEELAGLDVLLNEAVVLDAEFDASRRLLGLTMYLEMLPEDGERVIDDLYAQLLMSPVGQLAVSFRRGEHWEDAGAQVEALDVTELGAALRSIRNHDAIFGWRFFDVPAEEGFDSWSGQLSIDLRTSDSSGRRHTLTVWSEELVDGRETGRRALLDLRVWFDDLVLRDRKGHVVPLPEAIAAGRRYWERVTARGSGGPSPYPVPHVSIGLPD
jgi:hypothetical protein